MPKKTPWQEEKGEGEEEDKDNIFDDDVNDDNDEATASETLLSKPSRRETTTNNNNNILFPHHPPYPSKQQRHHHQTRLIIILLLTFILILCPFIFLLGFALGSSRQTTTTPTQSITNDDINDKNITNQPCFSHPSKPSPPLLPLPLHPLHLEASEKEETPPFPPTPSLQQKTFNGSFFHETKFRAKASPDVDRVWDSLGINCSFYSLSPTQPILCKKSNQSTNFCFFFLDRSILIPPHLAQPLGLKPNQHVHAKRKYGGGYVANLEGLHHLHCLVCLMLLTYFFLFTCSCQLSLC